MSEQYGSLMLISGTANPELSEKVARSVGVQLSNTEITRYSDGEWDVAIGDSVRGNDVFVLQPTCHPVNDNLMQLLIIIDALKRASASRITAVIPYYAYQRKEKKSRARDPISAKLVADCIEAAGASRVMAVDLHAEAIQGFFNVPVDALTAGRILAAHVKERHSDGFVVVSPDAGGTLRARRIASEVGAPMAMIDKRRPRPEVIEVVNVIGDVAGMPCVLVDDLISTGNTLVKAAEALRANGATAVDVVATHGVFVEGALERLDQAPIDEIVVTDTIPLSGESHSFDAHPKLKVLSVSGLLGEAIVRVHEGRSVSELFDK